MNNNLIYKYLSYEDALKTIENNSVVLNNPLNYNDPFDCIIDFDENDEKRVVKLLIEIAFVKEMAKLLNGDDLKAKWHQKPLIWFDKTMLNFFLKIIKKQRFYKSNPMFSLMAKFVLKIAGSKSDEVSKSIEKTKKKFIDELLPKLKEKRNKALVSCFSARNDSILMWGHYADKHKGICIGYERPEQDFYDVKYTTERTKFPLYDLACVVASCIIFDEKTLLDNEVILKKVFKTFLTKSKDWEYEKEIRCLFSLTNNQNLVDIGEGKFLYKMPNEIEVLYLGCKVKNEQKDQVLKLAKEKGIKVYQFIESKDKYELLSIFM